MHLALCSKTTQQWGLFAHVEIRLLWCVTPHRIRAAWLRDHQTEARRKVFVWEHLYPWRSLTRDCTIHQWEMVLQRLAGYGILCEHIKSKWCLWRRLYTWGVWRQSPVKVGHAILSYSGNPTTREKHMPYAYSGNSRLHLSHSLSKV